MKRAVCFVVAMVLVGLMAGCQANDGLTKRLDELQQTVAALEEDVAALGNSGDPESLRAAVAALETSLAALRTTVGALQSASGMHTTDIEAVRQQLAQVQAALEAAKARIDALENSAPKTYKFGDEITFVNNGIELFKVSLDSYEYKENSMYKSNFLYVTITNLSLPCDVTLLGIVSFAIYDKSTEEYYIFDRMDLSNKGLTPNTPTKRYVIFDVDDTTHSQVSIENATKFLVGYPNGLGILPYAVVEATLS